MCTYVCLRCHGNPHGRDVIANEFFLLSLSSPFFLHRKLEHDESFSLFSPAPETECDRLVERQEGVA